MKEKQSNNKKLVVIIPALNEEKTISSVIKSIPKNIDGINLVEILVVDDGSRDGTVQLAKEAEALVISHQDNQGVGAAFSTGLNAALKRMADVIVNIDADGQFNPNDIPKLINPIMNQKAEFVTCSRFKDKELIPQMPKIKLMGNKWMVKLINYITKQNFTDVSCGFRAYSREAALRLNLFGVFTYTQESFIDLAKKGIKMTEVALRVRGVRQFGKSRVASSILNYAYKTFIIIIRALRDYKPFRFFGVLGILNLIAGLGMGLFVFINWLITSKTQPFQSLIIGSSIGLILGFLLIVLALIADMLGRQRSIQEDILYFQKKIFYER